MTQPTNLPDFGSDLSLTFDLDPMGAEVSGLTCLSQALVRRITTPRGRLLDDPDYGFDVTGELEDDLTTSDVNSIGQQMDSEFVKDERVQSSVTTVTLNSGVLDTSSVLVTATGPFTLVLAISQVSVSVLSVNPS